MLRREKAALQEQLSEKDKTVQTLTSRVDEIGRQVGGSSAHVSSMTVQLMERVNSLSSRNHQLESQLQDAKQNLARLTREKTTC
jgi:predicted  nucleic acid-binding Zn-ribbon protein